MLLCDSTNIAQFRNKCAIGNFDSRCDIAQRKSRKVLKRLFGNCILYSVYEAVADFACLEHGLCFASQAEIAASALVSRRTCNIQLQVLENFKYKDKPVIRKTARYSNGLRSTNAYEILNLNTLEYQPCSVWLLGKAPKNRAQSARTQRAVTLSKKPRDSGFSAVIESSTNKNRASKYTCKSRTYTTRARESVPFSNKKAKGDMHTMQPEPQIKDLSALSNIPLIKEKTEERILRQMGQKVDRYIPDWTPAEVFEPLLQKGLQESAFGPLAKLALRLRKTKQQLKQNIQAVCEARSIDELFRFALCAIRDDYKPHIMVQPSENVRMPVPNEKVYKAVLDLDGHFVNGEAMMRGEVDGKSGIWLYKGDQSSYSMQSFYRDDKSYFSRSVGNVIARMHEYAKTHTVRCCYHQIVTLPPRPEWAVITDRLEMRKIERKLVPDDKEVEVRVPTKREDAMYKNDVRINVKSDFSVYVDAVHEEMIYNPEEGYFTNLNYDTSSSSWDEPIDIEDHFDENSDNCS